MNTLKLTPQIGERLERLRADRKFETVEQLLEEIISLADSVYAGARDGYSELVLRDPSQLKPNGAPKERLLVRTYMKKAK